MCARLCRAINAHRELSFFVLAIFLVLPTLLGRRAIILPLIYRHNLRAHAYLGEMTSPQPGGRWGDG